MADFHASGFRQSGTYDPDRLVVGDPELLRHTKGSISVAGDSTIKRGEILGNVYNIAISSPTSGLVSNFALTPGPELRVGRYRLDVGTVGAHGTSTWDITGPDLAVVQEDVNLNSMGLPQLFASSSGSTGTAVANDIIYFDVTLGSWVKCLPSLDSSGRHPEGICAVDVVNASSSAATLDVIVFTQGVFDENQVFSLSSSSLSKPVVRKVLRDKGCVLLSSIAHTVHPKDATALPG